MHIPFVWTAACQTALDTIKHAIANSSVLIYPDLNKLYHLFTDVIKSDMVRHFNLNNGIFKGKWEVRHYLSPPSHTNSGTLSLSQINWSTLVKEAYAIIMSFHKMAFYPCDAEVVIQSDHASLRSPSKTK